MSRRAAALVFIILIVSSTLFANMIETSFKRSKGLDKKTYSGTFGFEITVINETSFWISSNSDLDTEISSFTFANTTASQEIGHLVLQTKTETNYNFSISRTLLYLAGEATNPSMDYVLRFSDGTAYHEIPSSGSYSYTYTKSSSGNIKKSIGSFLAQVDASAAPASGQFISTISVALTVEE